VEGMGKRAISRRHSKRSECNAHSFGSRHRMFCRTTVCVCVRACVRARARALADDV
jgi:hypothetical protein